MDFTEFRSKVDEQGQSIWQSWVKRPESNASMPSPLFFHFTEGVAIHLSPLPTYLPKPFIVKTMNAFCQKEKVLHSCVVTEAYRMLLHLPTATEEEKRKFHDVMAEGKPHLHPEMMTETLHFVYSTIEEPHQHNTFFDIVRPEGLSPFLVEIPLAQAKTLIMGNDYEGLYFKG